mmetsp:Transcript_23167/g.59092  ORF Transcript_23167/g.59092 Transcript_23167/m.59092 type:complete len:361 (+) Transcript_23167:114-1196(+)
MPRAPVTASEPGAPCVVIDNGSGVVKSGFAGELAPRAELPASGLTGVGDVRPISKGIVQDWDAMEAYWDHAFTHQLGVDTEQCNLLVTSPLFDTKDNKERLMQTLFETFAAPGVYTISPAVLELYAAGQENGVVVGCGAECTYAVLVHEGLPDPRTQMRSDVAGDALTAWAADLLSKSAGASVDKVTAAKAKEALGAVASDSSGTTNVTAGTFALPDGRKLSVAPSTRVAMAEPLLEPSLVGQAGGGLAQLVAECIRLRDKDGVLESSVHGKDGTDNWYRAVVLGGASTMFPGLPQRLESELARTAPDGCTPKVHAVPERKHGAWLGGSILASLSTMSSMWISKDDYYDNGPLIVHRKCF